MSDVLLSVEQVVMVHDHILGPNESQGTAGGKFLDGALARVENRLSYGLVDDVYALAAAYAAAVSQAHCFNDGNKRTAFAATYVFLAINGLRINATDEETQEFLLDLYETGQLQYEHLRQWLSTNTEPTL